MKCDPPERHLHYIPCASRPDLLDIALRSMEPWWPVTTVIDNSDGRLGQLDLPPGVRLHVPPVPLFFTQVFNLQAVLAEAEGATSFSFQHADARVPEPTLAQFSTGLAGIKRSGRRWSIYDAGGSLLFAVDLAVFKELGRFDWRNFVMYYADNDWAYRCQLADAEWIRLHLPIEHMEDGSTTIRSAPEWKHWQDVVFPGCTQLYKLKWGGDPTHERYVLPWNDEKPPPEKERSAGRALLRRVGYPLRLLRKARKGRQRA